MLMKTALTIMLELRNNIEHLYFHNNTTTTTASGVNTGTQVQDSSSGLCSWLQWKSRMYSSIE